MNQPATAQIRDILIDLRKDMMQRITLILFIFGYILLNIAVLMRPFSITATLLAGALMITCALHRRLLRRNTDYVRYSYIVSLHLLLFLGIYSLDATWMAFWGVPLVLISGMLVSHSSLTSGIAISLAILLLDSITVVQFPLFQLLTLYILITALSMTAIGTFYVALTWYRSMHDRADRLLNETRNRRAELVQALKSLEISYDNQRRMQKQLIVAREQANEARRLKERFAANISHELRTPLNLILGFTEIIYFTPEVYGDGVSLPPKLLRDLHQVYSNSRHLLEMIDDVLDLSHIELSTFTMNREHTELNTFMETMLVMLNNLFRDGNVKFVADIAPHLPAVEIDRTRMRQVFLNLINNAQRFTSMGEVRLTAMQTGEKVKFTVSDTGIGIAPDKLPFIFDEFYQVDFSLSRQHGGAGLGLAITRRFVEAHGGELSVESEFGTGSTFTLTLPLRVPTASSITGQASTLTTEQGTVLVIDPDPAVKSIIDRYLKHYHVHRVASIENAHEQINRLLPDVIIHNRAPNDNSPLMINSVSTPVIDCSLPSMAWLLDDLGVAACLAKPITTRQLTEQIRRFSPIGSLLIVDDDLGFVQLVQRAIDIMAHENGTERVDFRVFRAYDGQQALDIINDERPDLLLLDLAMPDMNGFEVIDAVRSNPEMTNLPIILLTATRYVDENNARATSLTLRQLEGLNPSRVLQCLEALVNVVTT